MSTKESALCNGFDFYNMNLTGEVAKSLQAEGGGSGVNEGCVFYKTFRKKGHPQNSEQPQEWEESQVNDTLNIFDNSEQRTPTLITQKVYDWHRQDTRMTELGDVCVTAAAGWGGWWKQYALRLERRRNGFSSKKAYTFGV